ncbi:MAG: SMP-30/gluconolactonase/LRE family protein [Bacteroidales bacterium]
MNKILSNILLTGIGFVLCNSANSQTAEVKDLLKEGSFAKIEGPAIDSYGNLYAVNFEKLGTIGIVKPSGEASVYIVLPEGSVGNGIRFDKAGFMYIADYTKHNILKVNPRDKSISVFSHNPKMNQPNDIAISPNSEFLYASDPNWRDSTGNLWMINREGETFLLEGNIGTTNGIEVSPDGKQLYVNESIQRKIWVYDIRKDGFVKNKRLFYSFDDYGMDGMRCDAKGNLYVTRHGKGTIVVISKRGKQINEIALKGKLCSNITLDLDKKNPVFYVTLADRGCFEYFTLK